MAPMGHRIFAICHFTAVLDSNYLMIIINYIVTA